MALRMDGPDYIFLGNDMRPTYLCIEDIEDAPNPPRDVEGEQEANMIAGIGLTLWAWLETKEDENVRTNNETG